MQLDMSLHTKLKDSTHESCTWPHELGAWPRAALARSGSYREDVHAVDLDARHVVPARVVVVVGGAALLGGAHAVLVIFAHVDERQLPQRRHVESLEELALKSRKEPKRRVYAEYT
eukprot:4584376-Pleurochrysis_carterae.AAC.2